MSKAIVHLLRHGQVDNPDGVLYERLPGYHLSDIGRQMAQRLAEHTAGFDLVHLRVSPLERARETLAPIAEQHQLEPVIDERVIEAGNSLAGRVFTGKLTQLLQPAVLRRLYNPLRPSWGEAYKHIVPRMRAAIADAAAAAEGHEALIVSHQLPIWMARLDAEGRPLVHDPRKRQCSLASLTSFTVIDGRVARVDYAEPAIDLVPAKNKNPKKFVAGA
ncbi:histidine phosphatase family protein [Enemella evansiae]|uniref:Histidine phosphatase family protein n=1 Tax=Enemella evansiae TaxID=2016499 RepID=A0A255G8N1_9ACTN|nr:histidine phosphatase family protein [Enemella evansiae]OYO00128.1 histidine phosphatase family protein [Enemella evansiae]OYO04605.1 histidine phosphatase family protein [Enemella evansiae]OYO09159.1 histidine phosphatase family protein [Enemella evansiae]OYO11812.1 histidine phosphatase family protein [Enemella evansiae]OYO16892.1 histidine phosphatase family protein [Enemella evansiae]